MAAHALSTLRVLTRDVRDNRQRGLSLVELMVGITLGLMLMVGLGYLYAGGRQTFRVQDNLARVQENGRYAIEAIGRDLRAVGYMGCGSLELLMPQALATGAPAFSAATAVRGAESAWDTSCGTAPAGQLANTDSICIHKTDSSGEFLSTAMSSPTSDVAIAGNSDAFKAADVFLIADCTRADMFRASSDGTTSVGHGDAGCTDASPSASYNPCNNTSALGKAYGTDAMVMPFASAAYFLRNNPAGNPALYRRPWNGGNWGNVEEVVENVEDMQIVYGEDTDNDNNVDQYRTATNVANWAQVLAVRVSLLLRSPDNGVANQAQTYVWDTDNDGVLNNSVTAGDRRLHYVYTSTIGLRNRLR